MMTLTMREVCVDFDWKHVCVTRHDPINPGREVDDNMTLSLYASSVPFVPSSLLRCVFSPIAVTIFFSRLLRPSSSHQSYMYYVRNDRIHTQTYVFPVDESSDLVELKWIRDGGPNFTWITHRNIRFNPNIKPTQFKIRVSEAWSITKPWLNNNYTNLGVNITFSRLLTSSLLTIYIPSTLIVTLSWVSFWIDVNGIPGRISLGIMSILTIITQILDIRKNMPPVSYVTAIDIWLFVCLIAVFLSLIEYAFAYNYVRKVSVKMIIMNLF